MSIYKFIRLYCSMKTTNLDGAGPANYEVNETRYTWTIGIHEMMHAIAQKAFFGMKVRNHQERTVPKLKNSCRMLRGL